MTTRPHVVPAQLHKNHFRTNMHLLSAVRPYPLATVSVGVALTDGVGVRSAAQGLYGGFKSAFQVCSSGCAGKGQQHSG
jgi:hypothetical protein